MEKKHIVRLTKIKREMLIRLVKWRCVASQR
jgi:hypothetical protein